MSKYLLPISLALIFLVGLNSNESAHQNYTLNAMPTPTPTPDKQSESENFILDKNRVCRPCPPGNRPTQVLDADCDGNMAIAVFANKSASKNINYEYTVSGGKIIGKGEKVIWDMTGVPVGTYQIRIDFENEVNRQKLSETKTIEVTEYACCLPVCVCPTIVANSSAASVKAGEAIIFAADVRGGVEEITYNWTVSDGEIIGGQGTPVIKVATNTELAGKTVTAAVEIGGVCEDCGKTDSVSVSVIKANPDKK